MNRIIFFIIGAIAGAVVVKLMFFGTGDNLRWAMMNDGFTGFNKFIQSRTGLKMLGGAAVGGLLGAAGASLMKK